MTDVCFGTFVCLYRFPYVYVYMHDHGHVCVYVVPPLHKPYIQLQVHAYHTKKTYTRKTSRNAATTAMIPRTRTPRSQTWQGCTHTHTHTHTGCAAPKAGGRAAV
jgi:hypothetical protein